MVSLFALDFLRKENDSRSIMESDGEAELCIVEECVPLKW